MKIVQMIISGGIFVSSVIHAEISTNPSEELHHDPNQYTANQIQELHQENLDQHVSLLEFLMLMAEQPQEIDFVTSDPDANEIHLATQTLNVSEDSEGSLMISMPDLGIDPATLALADRETNIGHIYLGTGTKEEGALIYRFSIMGIIEQLDFFKDENKLTAQILSHEFRDAVSEILGKLSTHAFVIPSLREKAQLVLQKE